MSFVEWYEATYKNKWHEDYAGLYQFADKVSIEYEAYCKQNGLEPTWDG